MTTRLVCAVPSRGLEAAVSSSTVVVAAQAVIGMGRVVPAEQSSLPTRVVDLCPDESECEKDAAVLMQELRVHLPANQGESAWRARTRYTPSLAPLAMPAGALRPEAAFDGGATYVVTGGTGGLGVQWTEVGDFLRACCGKKEHWLLKLPNVLAVTSTCSEWHLAKHDSCLPQR